MRRARIAVVASLVAALAVAVPHAAAAPDAPFEMESLQLVLLMRAPTWKKLPAEEAEALQKRHIAHLEAMGKAGHTVVAGPFSDQSDPAYRGICIYRVGSVAEARRLAEQDPAVQAGQLRVEVMTWWFGKGYMTFPKAVQPAPAPAPTAAPTTAPTPVPEKKGAQ
jgi:uncharacterized protein YciI